MDKLFLPLEQLNFNLEKVLNSKSRETTTQGCMGVQSEAKILCYSLIMGVTWPINASEEIVLLVRY
jgi:hypothetical protein